MRWCFNSLAPGRYGDDLKSVTSKHMLWIKFMSTYEIDLFHNIFPLADSSFNTVN